MHAPEVERHRIQHDITVWRTPAVHPRIGIWFASLWGSGNVRSRGHGAEVFCVRHRCDSGVTARTWGCRRNLNRYCDWLWLTPTRFLFMTSWIPNTLLCFCISQFDYFKSIRNQPHSERASSTQQRWRQSRWNKQSISDQQTKNRRVKCKQCTVWLKRV